MTPDDLEKAIHAGISKALQEQLPVAVSSAVEVSVNHKIDGLRKEIAPITEAYKKWISLRRISLVAFGVFLAIGGAIQSAQAGWAVLEGIRNHFVIK